MNKLFIVFISGADLHSGYHNNIIVGYFREETGHGICSQEFKHVNII